MVASHSPTLPVQKTEESLNLWMSRFERVGEQRGVAEDDPQLWLSSGWEEIDSFSGSPAEEVGLGLPCLSMPEKQEVGWPSQMLACLLLFHPMMLGVKVGGF